MNRHCKLFLSTINFPFNQKSYFCDNNKETVLFGRLAVHKIA